MFFSFLIFFHFRRQDRLSGLLATIETLVETHESVSLLLLKAQSGVQNVGPINLN